MEGLPIAVHPLDILQQSLAVVKHLPISSADAAAAFRAATAADSLNFTVSQLITAITAARGCAAIAALRSFASLAL